MKCAAYALIANVAPYAGAWIETISVPAASVILTASPPTRGRGLKLVVDIVCTPQKPSPPTRGRGLKRLWLLLPCRCGRVAPYAGAWIEM